MYSQNDEEQVIKNYFGNFKGTFLDLGANDGITFSNTYALSLSGWSGILVEPSPDAFHSLSKLYSNKDSHTLFNLAIGNKDGVVKFHNSGTLLNRNDVSLVSTLNKSEKSRFEKSVNYSEIEVLCMTWKNFESVCPVVFHFVNIDIEGSELDVLPHMDLSMTKLICIEWNGKEDLKKEYEKYLSGFNLIHVTGENLIYGR